jgi:hypothetical protein
MKIYAVSVLLLSWCSSAYGFRAAAPSVYWDRSHTAAFTFNGPEGRYSEFADVLQSNGFVNYSGTAPLTSLNLSSYDVLVYGDAMVAFAPVTDDELHAIRGFVYGGGGLLLMSDTKNSGGYTEMSKLAALFGAQIGPQPFSADDVYSTRIDQHPAVRGVNSIYFRYSSTFHPGSLTSHAFHHDQPRLADVISPSICRLTPIVLTSMSSGMPAGRQLAGQSYREGAAPALATLAAGPVVQFASTEC